jgi:hypothetical protein
VNPGAFPEVIADVVLSSDDGDKAARLLEHDAPVDRKMSTIHDARDVWITSTEALIPSSIGAGALGSSRPLTAGQVPTVPPSGMRGRKHLHHATKKSDLVPRSNQVMFQVKLPPSRGPHSPLDLLASEIVLDACLRCFTRCHKVNPKLSGPCLLMMISLHKRGTVGRH